MNTEDFNPVPGQPEILEPGLVRVLAPNPSAMTFRGTNTYLVGHDALAVIDPGPDDPAHLTALLAAIGPRRVEAIAVTHSHVDHAMLAPKLAHATGAPVLAFGDSRAGRSPVMDTLAKGGTLGGGEGVDAAFSPDRRLADGETITGTGWSLTALWTPGHFGNHMCFASQGALFTGDHVMGWASSLVSPPDGDLSAFMASCRRLLHRDDRIFYPGHGAPVTAPKKRLAALIAHRKAREGQILAALGGGAATVASLTAAIYTDVAPALLPMAERNVLAHLIDLIGKNRVMAPTPLTREARFCLA